MVLLASFSHLYMGTIVPCAIALPLATAIYKYRHLHAPVKVFALYLLLNGLCNFVADALAGRDINNLPLLHVYTPVEFALLLLYYRGIMGNVGIARYTYIIVALFTGFCIINSLLLQSIYRYNSYAKPLSGIIIMVYALYYFKLSLDSETGVVESQKPYLWLNAGLLLYFGGSFFLFAYANLIPEQFMNTLMWNIHATLVLIMYLLFTTGLAYAKRER